MVNCDKVTDDKWWHLVLIGNKVNFMLLFNFQQILQISLTYGNKALNHLITNYVMEMHKLFEIM